MLIQMQVLINLQQFTMVIIFIYSDQNQSYQQQSSYNYFIEQQMKKIVPSSNHINVSHSNISTNDILNSSGLHECRFCKKIDTPDYSSNSFLYPCHCPEPLHTSCIIDQMKKTLRGEILTSKKQKHYYCTKCLHKIHFLFQATLKCRPCCELLTYTRKRRCLCTSLVIGTIILVGLIGLLIAIKTSQIKFSSSVLCSTTTIAVIIIISILFLILSYMFVSQIILEEQQKVSLLPPKTEPQHKKQSSRMEIVDCS